MPFDIILTSPAPLSITSLLVNLLIGAIISFVLSLHFQRFGRTLSNRRALGHVFPLIVLTTILVISVIKSSLALSLGLVGALSIVRFRTPIKEPEELAYLFVSIGVGLGLGADQRLVTVVGAAFILAVLAIRSMLSRGGRQHNIFVDIEVANAANDGTLERMIELLADNTRVVDARRLDVREGTLQATFLVDFEDDDMVVTVMNKLQERFPGAVITFLDQGNSVGG